MNFGAWDVDQLVSLSRRFLADSRNPTLAHIAMLSETLPRAAACGCPLKVAIIGDHVKLFETFWRSGARNQGKIGTILVVDRQLRTAAFSTFFSRVSDTC